MGMRKFFLILFLAWSAAYSQTPMRMLVRQASAGPSTPVVVAQFNFSATTNSVAGWTNVVGNPDAAVLTGSDSRGGYAVGVSTISSTDVQVWTGNGGVASANVGLTGSGHVLATGLYLSYFFNNNIDYV